jgi:hypothetical protein
MFGLSLLYLLLDMPAFWDHSSAIARAGLLCMASVTALSACWFALRTFSPASAAARTANLSRPTRERLRRTRVFLSIAGAIAVVVIGVTYFGSGRHLFRDWMIYLYPLAFIWPTSLADFIGEDLSAPRGTFGPRVDWADSKPIRSDNWGHRA